MFKRIFLIVIDSVGVGAMPDAGLYGDEGANTIGNTANATGGLNLPVMNRLGLGHLTTIKGVEPSDNVNGHYTKMAEMSVGKDTMTGHWELMGLRVTKPFQTFTENGFPESLIKTLEKKTGRKIVGNKAASGTDILDELGEHQLKTGDLIVYTSADSVLQISAHEEKVGLETLYKACSIARELTLEDKYKVGRVIARPFIGDKKGAFERTANRKDYALKPYAPTVLNALEDEGYDVVGFGKIHDIFDGEGITESIKQPDNETGMNNYINYAKQDFTGLAFLNLVDFDAKYGHRRDPEGYKNALEQFDKQLNTLINELRQNDILMVTADHGNDPTHHGTDHTREYVPLLMTGPQVGFGPIQMRKTFADVAATIADNFDVKRPENGTSFLKEVSKRSR